MKSLKFGILLALSSVTLVAQELSTIDSTEYFNFWVGDWTTSWDEGDGVKPFGRNRISKTLDGKVIQENFEIIAGKSKGFKGTSISVFQPRYNRWKQAWADNQGGYFDFEGEFDDGRRIFKTQVIDRGEKKVQQRMIFYDITDQSMTWDWEVSNDGGTTWNLQWQIFYTRIK